MTEVTVAGPAGENVQVIDKTDERYYELRVDGVFAAVLVYEVIGSRRILTHAIVEEVYRGRGLATQLVRAALDDIRAQYMTVTNYCTLVDHFISENPVQDLIDPEHPGIKHG